MKSPYSLMRVKPDAQQLLKCNINHLAADQRYLKGKGICKFPKQNQAALSELSF